MATDAQLDKTAQESERIISEFEKLQEEYNRQVAEETRLANELGAKDLAHAAEAGLKVLAPEQREQAERELQAFREELEKEMREIQQQHSAQASASNPSAGRASRFGRTV